MDESQKIRVGISIGDLNGIGPEVALRSFEDARMLDFCTPVIFASNKSISQQKKALELNVNFHGAADVDKLIAGKINVINCWKDSPELRFGEATDTAGKYAVKSLEAAVKALKNKQIDVLVTAPINKTNIQSESFTFPGHTDFLAKELQGRSLMFMVTPELKVGLLTDHVAVKDAPGAISAELIRDKANILLQSLRSDFGIRKPKLAVLGINPHSGDNGVIGREDEEVLKPVLKQMADEGLLVFGPYAADSFFGSDSYRQFDGVLAAYHDQGLIPFKTLAFGKGVNFTAGLSAVRTSPDHGTAYEIAGKGQADPSSFKEAVFTAIEIFRNRSEYDKLTENPLKKHKPKR